MSSRLCERVKKHDETFREPPFRIRCPFCSEHRVRQPYIKNKILSIKTKTEANPRKISEKKQTTVRRDLGWEQLCRSPKLQ